MKFVDLFCGTGAFSHVLEKEGCECVFANDMIDESRNIYDLNHTTNVFCQKDLNDIDVNIIPKHDLLCGGFPCQPFSIAGKQKGFNDERSNVFWKIIEILKLRQPSVVILENVKNLTSHDKGNTFRIIQTELEKVGYHIKYQIIDTCKISDIPQHRERIYIIGFLDKSKYDQFQFDFKEIENKPIHTFLDTDVPDKYYYTEKLKVFEEIKKNVTKSIDTNTVYQYRRYYVRENKSNCCPTLTANMGGGGHNVPIIKDKKGIRKLTPRECFNLQGFPASFNLPNVSDTKLYKLSGNAVSIPVVECIIKKFILLK